MRVLAPMVPRIRSLRRFDRLVQIDGLRLKALAPGERKQL